MLCYLTFCLPHLNDCCFEPHFITPGITNKKREKTTMVKEIDEERRKKEEEEERKHTHTRTPGTQFH